MTPANLAAIRKRLDGVTQGPWRYNPSKCYWPGVNGAQPVTTPQEGVFSDTPDGAPTIALTGAADDPQSMRDAAFIAAARQDVPDLLAEVERLRIALATIRFEAESAEDASALIDIADMASAALGGP